MHARSDNHPGTGHRGGASARRRGALSPRPWSRRPALSLAVGAVPASAAGGYTVTATITVGAEPAGVAVDRVAGTVYVANYGADTVSVIDGPTRT